MKWTKTPPTEPGWYWVKCRGMLTGNVAPAVLKVTKMFQPRPRLVAWWDGEAFNVDSDSFVAWGSAPVEPPEGEPA